jgi:hypothetical protein
MTRRTALTGLLLLCAWVGAALAHDFFLMPGDAAPAVGTTFDLAMHISGVFPGPATNWRKEQVKEFFLVDAAGRADLREAPLGGLPTRARLNLRRPGLAAIALTTSPAYIALPAKEFQTYLKEEGHDDILEMRSKMKTTKSPGRERYSRFVKALIVSGTPGAVATGAGAPGTGAAAASAGRDPALAALGLTLEIVPEVSPVGLQPGTPMPVRVLFEGFPYAGGRLCAAHAADPGTQGGGGDEREHKASKKDEEGYDWCGALDTEGRASVPVPSAGWYLLRITRMRALAGDDRADWMSYWGSLTFHVAGEAVR